MPIKIALARDSLLYRVLLQLETLAYYYARRLPRLFGSSFARTRANISKACSFDVRNGTRRESASEDANCSEEPSEAEINVYPMFAHFFGASAQHAQPA